MRVVPEEKKAQIREALLQGTTHSECVSKFGTTYKTVARIAESIKISCPNCGKVPPVGSKFCNCCGKKLMTEREEAIVGLKKAAGLCAGAVFADEIREAIFAAVKYLEGRGE